MKYDFSAIESKWQKRWEEAHIFEAQDASDKPKFYGLVEFPYPSGVGMHVGHIKAYSGLEVVSRKRRMQGYNVLFPIGFDAFGLPTENSAIKTGIHPRELTDRNIRKFTQQLKRVGFSFDWTRVIDTTEEDYYRWTQYVFLKMFEKGLAFRSTALVNYCPHCKVVLSTRTRRAANATSATATSSRSPRTSGICASPPTQTSCWRDSGMWTTCPTSASSRSTGSENPAVHSSISA